MSAALERLRERVADAGRLVIGYSGGVDSSLLARVATDVLGRDALAVTAVSPSLGADERRRARAFAREHGIAQLEVGTDEMDRAAYVANGADRCFHCKSALFDALDPLAGMLRARTALGTNLDDLGDHRPGQRAAADRGARFPLVEAGLDKAAVRAVSDELGLSTAGRPAAPCLASRVAYGEPVTPELLARIEAAERAVRAEGFADVRVRAHGDGTVGRIELPDTEAGRAVDVRHRLDAAVRAAGFTFCALDLGGFASGRLNALLPLVETDRAS